MTTFTSEAISAYSPSNRRNDGLIQLLSSSTATERLQTIRRSRNNNKSSTTKLANFLSSSCRWCWFLVMRDRRRSTSYWGILCLSLGVYLIQVSSRQQRHLNNNRKSHEDRQRTLIEGDHTLSDDPLPHGDSNSSSIHVDNHVTLDNDEEDDRRDGNTKKYMFRLEDWFSLVHTWLRRRILYSYNHNTINGASSSSALKTVLGFFGISQPSPQVLLAPFWEDVTPVRTDNLLDSSPCSDTTTSNSGRVEDDSPIELVRVTENLHCIQHVLNYWFGQHNGPDIAQKKLWMIAQQSIALRRQVDRDITKQFGTLVLELIRHDESNSMTTDIISSPRHRPTHRTPTRDRWSEWCQDEQGQYGYRGKLAAIVVLDQFSRHIRRYIMETADDENSDDIISRVGWLKDNLPNQGVLDHCASETTHLLIQQHYNEIKSGMIPIPMYIFGLMPYRHSNDISKVQWVQKEIEYMNTLFQQGDTMLRRFRKATNRRLAILQDQARNTVIDKNEIFVATAGMNTTTGKDQLNNCDGNNHNSGCTDHDILECFPFEADLAGVPNHVVYKTIRKFLDDRGMHPTSTLGCATTSSTIRPIVLTPIIVSLSGGVDSMVIVSVLAQLANKHISLSTDPQPTIQRQQRQQREVTGQSYYPIDITAVHIDYANRPESFAEANYVRWYCEQLHVKCKVRRIIEVTRGVTARDAYERISREIRFNLYRETIEECRTSNNPDSTLTTTIGVMLGHHRGDLRENVLSNANKGSGPLDLSGMTAVSCNDGVTLYRPLLPLEKNSIFDYAHKFGIPYFKDSTPHWSTRGKLRNRLLPLLEEIYGEGCMGNLSTLAVESDECRSLLDSVAFRPFLEQVRRYPMGISFTVEPWRKQGWFFWKFVLREVLHSIGLGMFTDGSVSSFLERVLAPTHPQPGWLQCRKDYAVYFDVGGDNDHRASRVIVLHPSSFPWNQSDHWNNDCQGQLVEFDITYRVGPWSVSAILLGKATEISDVAILLEQKAVSDMDVLLQGHVVYYLEVPSSDYDGDGTVVVRPLIYTKYTKSTRPRAWKGVDTKIQDILPLLDNDERARSHLYNLRDLRSDDATKGSIYLAKVTLRLS